MESRPRGTVAEIKTCEQCGRSYGYGAALPEGVRRVRRQGGKVWEKRRFCSPECRGLAIAEGKVQMGRRNLLADEEVSVEWGRIRMQRRIPIEGKLCQICGDPAQIRHHRDEDPRNNADENIAVICRACHMWIHKRRRKGSLEEARRRHEIELARIRWIEANPAAVVA